MSSFFPLLKRKRDDHFSLFGSGKSEKSGASKKQKTKDEENEKATYNSVESGKMKSKTDTIGDLPGDASVDPMKVKNLLTQETITPFCSSKMKKRYSELPLATQYTTLEYVIPMLSSPHSLRYMNTSLFDNTTHRVLICGSSGSGKSNVLSQLLPFFSFDKLYLFCKQPKQSIYSSIKAWCETGPCLFYLLNNEKSRAANCIQSSMLVNRQKLSYPEDEVKLEVDFAGKNVNELPNSILNIDPDIKKKDMKFEETFGVRNANKIGKPIPISVFDNIEASKIILDWKPSNGHLVCIFDDFTDPKEQEVIGHLCCITRPRNVSIIVLSQRFFLTDKEARTNSDIMIFFPGSITSVGSLCSALGEEARDEIVAVTNKIKAKIKAAKIKDPKDKTYDFYFVTYYEKDKLHPVRQNLNLTSGLDEIEDD